MVFKLFMKVWREMATQVEPPCWAPVFPRRLEGEKTHEATVGTLHPLDDDCDYHFCDDRIWETPAHRLTAKRAWLQRHYG